MHVPVHAGNYKAPYSTPTTRAIWY